MRRERLAPSIAAISLAWTVALGSTTALAQNADAEALFSEGESLLKSGKVGEACDAFEASNRIEPRAGTLVNLGLCREQNGQLASAWSAFKDAASRAKDPKKKQIADQRIAAIEPKLSYLTILVADESRVDGLAVARNGAAVDPALWNRAAPVDGGKYTVAGRAPGHEEWSTTVEVPNELGKISVEVPRFKELAKLVTPPPTVTPVTPPVVTSTESETEGQTGGMFTGRRKLAIGVGAVGLLGIGAGVIFGIQANGLEADAFALCPDPAVACGDGARANDLISQGQSRATLSYISFGVGGAAVIGAAVLWYLGAPTSDTATVTAMPRASRDGVGLDVRFAF